MQLCDYDSYLNLLDPLWVIIPMSVKLSKPLSSSCVDLSSGGQSGNWAGSFGLVVRITKWS